MKKLNKEVLQQLVEQIFNSEEKVSAVIVVKSKKTGADFTYHIKSKWPRGTHVMTIGLETSYADFTECYILINGNGRVNKEKKERNKNYAGAVWLLDKLFQKDVDTILEHSILYHTGKCIKCNRPLTDADSIEYGMGPICRGVATELNREEP